MEMQEIKQERIDCTSKNIKCIKCQEYFSEDVNVLINLCEYCTASNFEKRFNDFVTEKFYACSVCFEALISGKELFKHDCTMDNVFICNYCNFRFGTKTDLIAHIEKRILYVITNEYKPNFCNMLEFYLECKHNPSKIVLNSVRHNMSHEKLIDCKESNIISSKITYCCKVCNRTFPSSSQLTVHKAVHSNVKKFPCAICPKSFKYLGSLKRHNLTVHSTKRPYECKTCFKKFKTKYLLSRHWLIHSKVKNFECEICLKRFKNTSELTKHKYIHATDKKYSCKICSKSFLLHRYLKRHMDIHSSIKKYRCKICLNSFRSHNLTKHLKTHFKEKKHKCQICSEAFKTACALKSHKNTHLINSRI